jgi:hypothetical protein
MTLVDTVDQQRFTPGTLDRVHDLALPHRRCFPRRFGFDPDEHAVVAHQIIHRTLAVAVRHRHEPVTFGVTVEHFINRLLDGPFGPLTFSNHFDAPSFS